MIRTLTLAALLAAAPAAPAQDQKVETPSSEVPPAEQARIPFIGRDGILDFRTDGDRGAWIRSQTGDWYYARTGQRCPRLAGTRTLGFQTSALDQLDRHGAIVAQGVRCPIQSLTRSDPPPDYR